MKGLRILFLALLISIFSTSVLVCFGHEVSRGGIEYSFSESAVVYIGSQPYLSFEVMASATSREDELGTGIILLGYNTSSFGPDISFNNNVIVTRGELLDTSPTPLYELILNDYDADCLAITFEYTSSNGMGNTLTINPKQLFNIKMKILDFGQLSGLSFFQTLMQEQQYEDDNYTLLNPVTAIDADTGYIAATPVNLNIVRINETVMLTWQEIPGFSYNVYFATSPASDNWQQIATGLTQPFWVDAEPVSHRFYYVTSRMISERGRP